MRLPLWLTPIHYDIDMKPDIYQDDPEDFTNTGTVMIHMRCDAPTEIVTVHANKLVITSQSMVDNGKMLTSVRLMMFCYCVCFIQKRII